MSLRVGLNGACFTNLPSGANQRFLGIYGHLAAQTPEIQFTIYSLPGSILPQQFPRLDNVEIVEVPITGQHRFTRYLEGLFIWENYLKSKRLDIFEQFHLPLVRAPQGSTLLTIHDVRALVAKSNPVERTVGQIVFSKSIKEASHVITVSNSMKQQILDFFPDAKVSVIYNGFEASRPPDALELDGFTKKYSLPQEFLLSVGHLEVRKNYRQLIEALAVLKDRGQALFLLIVGNDNGEGGRLQNLIASRGLSSQIKLLSGLSHRELQCAYVLSQLFIFPSTYEGFGIPILEAMASRTPMILSDIPVFREITENQGVYFSPDDIGELAEKITYTLDSKSEQSRIISYGSKRLEGFKFSILAKQVKNLYVKLGHSLT